MIDKYGFDLLESCLFVLKCLFRSALTALKMSAAQGALEVPGSVKALYAKQAFVVLLLFLPPLKIWISL